MEKQITVIVPCYNASKHLYLCMQSLIHQTYKNFHVIAINDGSTDDTLDVLKNYQKYLSMDIITTRNSGCAKASNTGLRLVNTPYFLFVDSDDSFSKDFIKDLYCAALASDSDITTSAFNYVVLKDSVTIKHPFYAKGLLSQNEAISLLLEDLYIQSYRWGKLYKTSLFDDFFYPDMTFEDMATTIKVFLKAKNVYVVKKALYNYYQHGIGMLGKMNRQKIVDFALATQEMIDAIKNEGLAPLYKEQIKKLCRKTALFSLIFLFRAVKLKNICVCKIPRYIVDILDKMKKLSSDEYLFS